LPQPEGPSSMKNSPLRIVKLDPFTAGEAAELLAQAP
jgi:hypothetical protein